MKKTHAALLAVSLLFTITSFAQTKDYSIYLKDGKINVEPNLDQLSIENFNKRSFQFNKAFGILQFDSIPSEAEKNFLAKQGIVLLDYIPNNAYTVSITENANASVLKRVGARALFELEPKHKMSASLKTGIFPAHAVKVIGTIDTWVVFPKTFTSQEVVEMLTKLNINIVSTQLQEHRIIEVRIATNRLIELAALPFVEYVQPIPVKDQPLNLNSRIGSRANVLNASVANGGKGLNGEGVVMGIGDNADVIYHIDFSNRFINRTYAPNTAAHGIHVSGTATGAGIINELYRGYAPKATFINQYFSGVWQNAATYVQDYGMVITNNSYGAQLGCDYNGTYDVLSRILDQQALDLPNLQQVFASGNSGGNTCLPYPPGFRTVLGSYQSAKNVVVVGNTTDAGVIVTASSKGPVRDGRIKPEIAAMGTNVVSGWNSNFYAGNNGTSMAAPAVSGGLALLYQRYRQLNGNADRKNGLMKALLVNGATDKANVGPDYSYGFGWMNLLRSVDMLEQGRYFNNLVAHANVNTHTINVPANSAHLKVMLYWNDPAASLLSNQALVHDLDLEVIDLSTNTLLPFVLDTAAANVANPATTGVDKLNNIEQVVINNPPAGNYTVRVKGTAVTQTATQEYFVAYDIIPVETRLTYPVGGEGLVPGETVKITWESYGDPANNFTIQYSIDNGANWVDISTSVAAAARQLNWTVPSVSTDQALVRISRNGTALTSTSNPFTIIGLPTVSLSATQCESYIAIDWTATAGASDYEIMMLQNGDMVSVATTTANSYTFNGLNKDSIYWVTVRPRVNGKEGRRAVAIQRQPNSGTCTGAISDNDLKVNAILSPTSGRKFTSTELTAATTVSVQIKNLDDAAISNFDMQYSIDGGSSWTTPETVTATVSAGATYDHTFSITADLSATGNYPLVVVVKYLSDPVAKNDTLSYLIKHIQNDALNLATDFVDDIESATTNTYLIDTIGIDGVERYDFANSTIYGRLRTFVNSGIAYSGSKALTLDIDRYYIPGNVNYLYGTFNLSNYNAAVNDVRLDFQYNNHGQVSNANNKVWVRGSDTQPWIEANDLYANQNDPGVYKQSLSIELGDLLVNNGQVFTSSFQVRWGQYGQVPATDKTTAAGYTIDDIHVYEVFDDLQMISIDTPIVSSCGLSNAVSVIITVRNSANTTVSNIPVQYRVNGGNWSSGTIASIAGNTSIQYTFPSTADLAAFGTHTIEAVVNYPTDTYRDNDTVMITINNAPVISSFPYLQNFEADNGYWYAGGIKSSWEYGTPSSTKINGAASGAKAWKTRLTGGYNDDEHSYLYSPCFDVSTMTNPTLSFSVALDIEDCGSTLCDGVWVEYSADGKTWTKLGTSGAGTNWYNKAGTQQLWSIQDYTRWHVATTALPTGIERLRFRFVLVSDPGVTREGIAIDDIHVYDNTKGIYDGVTLSTPVTQNISGGNNWVDFESGGKLISSVHPNNQNLGATDVQVFINTAGVRNTNNQYYHDRNITIKPTVTSLADSTIVRFYFLDSESEALIAATGCSGCSKPTSAYRLGVSKYTDIDKNFENGTVSDNNQGIWSFITSATVIKVPFDKGYYAEFKVKDFSEFWLNNGGFNGTTPLPVKILDFFVQKANSDVLVKWKTAAETNVDRYEIEVARGTENLNTNNFQKIGDVASQGNSVNEQQYSFTDTEAFKTGVRYYRLKIFNTDGSFKYSIIRSLVFSNDEITWQIYPNPSKDVFHFMYQMNADETMFVQLTDATGRVIKTYKQTGDGFIQKLQVDLSGFASGVYLLQATKGSKNQTFKLYKQ